MERIDLYLRMLETIFQHNRDVLSHARVYLIIKKLSVTNPDFLNLVLSDEMELVFRPEKDMDENRKRAFLTALRSLLEEYYLTMSASIGKKEALKRVQEAARKFLSTKWKEVEEKRIEWYFPILPLVSLKKSGVDLKTMNPGDRGKLFFENLFTAYITDLTQSITPATYLRKLENLKKTTATAEAIEIKPGGWVNILIPVINPRVVKEMCDIFNSFVDLSTFAVGEEKALFNARRIAAPVYAYFSPFIKDLVGVEYLLYGTVTPTAPSLIKGMNRLIRGGFPKGKLLLFQVPGAVERTMIMDHLVADALRLKNAVILVLSSRFPGEVSTSVEKKGVRVQQFEKKKMFYLVDWYSHQNESVVGIEENGVIIKSGKDLTNMEIAVERALKNINNAYVLRFMFESFSSVLKTFDEKSSSSLLQSLKKKVSQRNAVGIVFIEKDVHDRRTLSYLQNMFDGVLDIYRDEKGLVIRVISLAGRPTAEGAKRLRLSPTSFEIAVGKKERDLSEEEIRGLIRRAIEKAYGKRTPPPPLGEAAEKTPAPSQPPTKPEEEVPKEEHYRRAVQYATENNFVAAKREFMAALQKDPGYVEALYGLGALLLYGENNLDEAVKILQKVVSLQPDNGDALFDLGNAFYRKGEREKAREYYLRARAIKPHYQWYNRDEFLCATCNAILRRGTTTCPVCGSKFDDLGNPVEEGHITGAAAEGVSPAPEAKKAVKFLCPVCGSPVRPDDTRCPKCGAVFEPVGGKEEAAKKTAATVGEELGEHKKEGVERDVEAFHRFLREKNWPALIEVGERLMSIEPRPEWVIGVGTALTEMGQFKKALVLYRDHLQKHKSDREVLGAISYTLMKMGKKAEARKYAKACLKYMPDNPLANLVLSKIEKEGEG